MRDRAVYVRDGLSRRSKESWRLSYHQVFPDGSQGKRLFATINAAMRRDAVAESELLLSLLNSSTEERSREMTLGEIAREIAGSLLGTGAIEEKTYTSLLSSLRLAGDLADKDIREIAREDVTDLLSELVEEGYSPSTVNGVLRLIKRCFSIAVEDRIVECDVTRYVKGPKASSTKVRSLKEEERHRLIAVLDCTEGVISVASRLALATGLRRGEVCGLKWRDIDFASCRLSVRRSIATGIKGRTFEKPPKTAASIREIPLEGSVAEALKERRAEQVAGCRAAHVAFTEDLYVFGDIDGGFLRPNDLGSRFADLCRSFSIADGKCRFHWLRHTFATTMIALGVDVRTVAAWLGHADPGFTLHIYVDLNERAMEDSVSMVSSLLSVPAGYAASIGLPDTGKVETVADSPQSPGLALVEMALPRCSSCPHAKNVADLVERLFRKCA